MEQKKWNYYLVGFIGVLILLTLLARGVCLTFVDNYEFAYKFDKVTGTTEPLINSDGTYVRGYVFQRPFVDAIHTIDLRPFQICISANSRVLNCKLVRFNPKGFKTFIDWHGRGDYSKENLEGIFMSYAYDPTDTDYPFLLIDKGTNNDKIENANTKNQIVTDSISK